MSTSDLNTQKQDRIKGCLMGQAVGDALGTRYEFERSAWVEEQIYWDSKGDHLKMRGQGPFNLIPGQFTDDTELAMALASSLVELKEYNIHSVANRYAIWYHSQPFDIGNTTRNAFGSTQLKPEKSDSNYNVIKKSSALQNMNSLSNGCLMRISPLAIAGLDWKISSLKHAAKLNCELTNPNPVAIDAVQVFVVALQTAMNTGDRKLAYDNAFKVAQTDEVRNLLLYSNKRPDPVILSNGRSVSTDSNFMGYLGIALQNTFYELLHGTSFEQSLVNIISRGGDTDTNGCIAGALLGAIYGYSQIPEDWSQTVLKADPKERIEQYPWAKTTDLLEIATRLPHTKEP